MSSYDETDHHNHGLLSDAAMASLQLGEQPFAAELAEGSEWFVDDTAQAQLEDIKHALISGDDLLLILGPEGAGKSTLLAQLGANSGQRIQCFSVRGSERFSTYNLFAGMLEAFQKPAPDDLKLLLDDLIPSLQGMMSSNTLGAVVLDDAHHIPEAELTKLLSGMLYINSSDETVLRVCLAAPTEFEERIPELLPEGADLPYSSLAMEAFDKVRSKQYIEHRLSQAGAYDAQPFTDREIAQINQDAGGRPGALHRLAAGNLNTKHPGHVADLPPELQSSQKKRGALAAIPGSKLLLGALALCMILAGLFFFKPKPENTVADTRYTVQETRKITPDEAQPEDSTAAGSNVVSSDAQTANTENAEAETAATNNTTDATAAAAAKIEAAKAKAEADRIAEESAAAAQQAADEKAAEELAAKKAAEEAEAAKLAAEKAEAEAEAKIAAAAKAQEEAKIAAEAKAAEDAAAAAKAEADAAAAARAAELGNLESPNWVLVQDPKLFTVQMSASTDRESVENFLARNQLDAPNSIFSFTRNGRTWFALVHGLFGSIEEARSEIEKMPASAQSNQPWIRGVGRIQNALKEQN